MTQTLAHVLLDRAAATPDGVAYRVLPRGATALGDTITWREWARGAERVARALIARGVAVGDRILIFSDNRPMWPIVDLGALMAGVVCVGAYPTSAAAQIASQLRDSGAQCVFVDNATRLDVVRSVRDQITWPLSVVVDEPAAAQELQPDETAWINFVRDGDDPSLDAVLRARMQSLVLDQDAMLIYTSGSTGEPRGARISHRYLLASAESIAHALSLQASDSGVSFLPFCHAAERVFGLYVRLHVGMSAVLVEAPEDVFTATRLFEPTVFGGLPRLFEKLARAAQSHSDPANGSQALHALLGARCRIATSGGAALSPSVADTLHAAGLTVLGAYGQTEHLCIAMNRPGAARFETVGPAMPGTEVRIAEDGELLVRRNALTFSGYFGKPAETEAAFTADGEWLHTGDLAEQEPDGALRIVGRRKELIALSTGKKVAPLPIEAALCASPLIASAMCYGEGRRFLSAVLQVQPEARALQVDIRPAVQAHVDHVNSALSRTEQVRAFVIATEPWTVETGELTPTLKLKRPVIIAQFQEALDALYVESSREVSA
jgi:long-chain acyl-CoA synthetase